MNLKIQSIKGVLPGKMAAALADMNLKINRDSIKNQECIIEN